MDESIGTGLPQTIVNDGPGIRPVQSNPAEWSPRRETHIWAIGCVLSKMLKHMTVLPGNFGWTSLRNLTASPTNRIGLMTIRCQDAGATFGAQKRRAKVVFANNWQDPILLKRLSPIRLLSGFRSTL